MSGSVWVSIVKQNTAESKEGRLVLVGGNDAIKMKEAAIEKCGGSLPCLSWLSGGGEVAMLLSP